MSLAKPSIYDTTIFDLVITGLDKNVPTLVGVTTGLTDVVYVVEWTLTATHESNSVSLQGSTQLESPSSSNFTEFKKLDSDLVQGWVMKTDDFLHEKYICCNLILKQRDEDSNTLSMAVPW